MGEINVMERNLVPRCVFPHFRVIRDDTSDVAMKFSAAPTLKDIHQTMRRFGGQQRHLGSPAMEET